MTVPVPAAGGGRRRIRAADAGVFPVHVGAFTTNRRPGKGECAGRRSATGRQGGEGGRGRWAGRAQTDESEEAPSPPTPLPRRGEGGKAGGGYSNTAPTSYQPSPHGRPRTTWASAASRATSGSPGHCTYTLAPGRRGTYRPTPPG